MPRITFVSATPKRQRFPWEVFTGMPYTISWPQVTFSVVFYSKLQFMIITNKSSGSRSKVNVIFLEGHTFKHRRYCYEWYTLLRNDQSWREVDEETQDSPAPLEKIGFKRRSVAVMSGSGGRRDWGGSGDEALDPTFTFQQKILHCSFSQALSLENTPNNSEIHWKAFWSGEAETFKCLFLCFQFDWFRIVQTRKMKKGNQSQIND